MKKTSTVLLFIILMTAFSIVSPLSAQKKSKVAPPAIERVEPMFWWVGMKNPSLQLIVKAKNLGSYKASIDYPGVKLTEAIAVENNDFLFLNLHIASNAKPGKFAINFKNANNEQISYQYELKERRKGSAERQGVTPADAIYMLMPDRFANGDPNNDNLDIMREKTIDRTFEGGRRGGDLAGINKNLDYFQKLGITALWLTPFQENDMKKWSYHGYSITDHYKTDPRFGTNDDYANLVKNAHQKGIKVIMDLVFNHSGGTHWIYNESNDNLPFKDWLNQWSEFTRTNYHTPIVADPYASEIDLKTLVDGWFESWMPDWNQRNPMVIKYLIQNSIWWIEYADIDGIRMDTYPYPDKHAMATWVKEVMNEYPNFFLVGETWISEIANQGYWHTDGRTNIDGYDSPLPSITDFPLHYGLLKTLQEGSMRGVYDVLTNDFVYKKPINNVIFADNHDMDRFFAVIGKDMQKYKIGIGFMLTTRGIPQIFYGTEVLFSGTGHHGVLREEFLGGWADHSVNAFTGAGLPDDKKEAQEYMTKLLQWRKNKTAIHNGKLKHYLPHNDVYVYSRYNDNDAALVIMSTNKESKTLKMKRFSEILSGYTKAVNVITGEEIALSEDGTFTAPSMSIAIFDLKK